MHAEDYRYIRDVIAPPITTVIPSSTLNVSEETRPFGFGEASPAFDTLDMNILVDERRRHETRQARTGVRSRNTETSPSDSKELEQVSVRKKIIQRFHEELKKQQDRGATTGQGRKTHYGLSSNTEKLIASPTPGNAANAAAVASSAAKKVSVFFGRQRWS